MIKKPYGAVIAYAAIILLIGFIFSATKVSTSQIYEAKLSQGDDGFTLFIHEEIELDDGYICVYNNSAAKQELRDYEVRGDRILVKDDLSMFQWSDEMIYVEIIKRDQAIYQVIF